MAVFSAESAKPSCKLLPACTSRPMTGSYLVRAATAVSALVTIISDYSPRRYGQTLVDVGVTVFAVQASERNFPDLQLSLNAGRAPNGHPGYGLRPGALRYFSRGTSKYITSFPFASRKPVR